MALAFGPMSPQVRYPPRDSGGHSRAPQIALQWHRQLVGTLRAPANCPKMVTLPGSPPKILMFFPFERGAATDRVDLKPPRHTPTLPSLAAIAAAGAPFVPGSNTAAHPAASARTKIILDRDHRPGARVSSSGSARRPGNAAPDH